MPGSRERTIRYAVILALFDTACIFAAFFISALATVPETETLGRHLYSHMGYFLVLTLVWCLQALDQRLFVSRRIEALIPQLFTFTKTVFTSLVLSIFILALLNRGGLEREFALTFVVVTLLTMVLLRTTMRLSIWGLRQRGYNFRRIVLIGANARAAHVAEIILSHEHYGFQIVGFLDDDETRKHHLERYNIPYLGKVRELERYLVEGVIDVVYISLPVRSHYENIQSIAHLCEGVGVPVRLIADLFPLRIATSKLMRVADIPLLALSAEPETQAQMTLRRAMDLVVSSILLVILSPLLLVIAVLIKMDSTGPILVREPRLSARADRPFKLYKFRTEVWTPSTEEGVDLTSEGEEKGSEGRTRVGRFLIRYSLDELPQLINIWLGQMSLVEPPPGAYTQLQNHEEPGVG